jgi:tetratricopeptide (TPR) repeat protein
MNTRIKASACAVLALALVSLVAFADELRNLDVGQKAPAFRLRTLGGQDLSSESLQGKVTVLIFVSAEQHSSETALKAATEIARSLTTEPVDIIAVTADAAKAGYFREFRDSNNVHFPLMFDIERTLYGDLGLIVLPTTVILDRDWHLAHVISSVRSDYQHMLESYILHALGRINDDELTKRLETEVYERNRDEDHIARHRAAARLLRQRGLLNDAVGELEAALRIDATHINARLDLAAVRIDQEEYAAANQLVNEVLEDDPNQRKAKLLHGIVLYHQGQLDEAETLLKQVLLLNPDPIYTHYYLGLIAQDKAEHAKAAMHFREALDRALRERPL